MTDWKVKIYLVLISILSPILLLLSPLANGLRFIGERHFEVGCVWQVLNLLLAPLIVLFCGLVGVVAALLLTIPTMLINSVRFWRIVLTESGLNICCRRLI